MGKVVVDTDVISRDLIPASNTNLNYIRNAFNNANAVGTSEYNWGNIKSRIEDCVEAASKYSEWINSINTSYNSCCTSNLEELGKIEINEVKRSVFTVK